MIQAADGLERVLDDPKPAVRVTEFADSSINLELRVWIMDPEEGVGGIKSDVLLAIWDLFKKENIEIPFPQRDIHIKSSISSIKSPN